MIIILLIIIIILLIILFKKDSVEKIEKNSGNYLNKNELYEYLIKDNDNSIRTITPKEGEIIFFPGYLWHVPTHTPTATIDRIVIAGNITSEFLLNTSLI